MSSAFGTPVPPPASAAGPPVFKDRKMQFIEQHILDLCNPDLRENALHELSKVYIYIYIYLALRTPLCLHLSLFCFKFSNTGISLISARV